MKQAMIRKYWWVPLLAIFDLIYYYFIQHLTGPKPGGLLIRIHWEGVFFLFLVSLFSLGCIRWVKGRIARTSTRSIPLKYLQILFYSLALFILLTGSIQFFVEAAAGQQRSLEYILGNLIVYIFLHIIIGNTYIAIEFFRESMSLQQDLILTEKAKTESELKILQQQMNPHFLFNNLNTLVSLIQQDKNKAIGFARDLSTIFRYISQNAKKDLITLREEIDFLVSYVDLLHFRFGTAYSLDLQLEAIDTGRVLVVPLALQVVIENVVKHNSGSRSNPLRIEIVATEHFISIKNEVRPKAVPESVESGIGLKNLQERFGLTTGKHITYGVVDGYFVVQLPVIKSIGDEGLNH